ncbi:MAG: hypothetical protein WKF84_07795 [Pyrinomonadaceae bacterium]
MADRALPVDWLCDRRRINLVDCPNLPCGHVDVWQTSLASGGLALGQKSLNIHMGLEIEKKYRLSDEDQVRAFIAPGSTFNSYFPWRRT